MSDDIVEGISPKFTEPEVPEVFAHSDEKGYYPCASWCANYMSD